MHAQIYSICSHSIYNLHSELFLSGLGRGSASSVLCTSAQLLYDYSKHVLLDDLPIQKLNKLLPACDWITHR